MWIRTRSYSPWKNTHKILLDFCYARPVGLRNVFPRGILTRWWKYRNKSVHLQNEDERIVPIQIGKY
jgi:hypothetical protein